MEDKFKTNPFAKSWKEKLGNRFPTKNELTNFYEKKGVVVYKSVCCKEDVVESFKDNPKDHHDPIEIYTCSKCGVECDAE